MSLALTVVWEVRPTVGNDTNGGGFDPSISGAGTDYSQQNAKNSTGSNKSTTDGVAVGTTTFTSATASFTSAIIGNIIYLSGSGITAGWYEVTGYTNGTTITLDRNPGTGTGVTLNIGGALATVLTSSNPFVAGNIVWIKATGTLTETAQLIVTQQSGGSNNPAQYLGLFGYTTTRGDGGQVNWTTSTNSASLIQLGSSGSTGGLGLNIKNINFTSTAGSPGYGIFVGNNYGNFQNINIFNCTFSGFISGVYCPSYGNTNSILQFIMRSCEVKDCSGAGIVNCGGGSFIDCFVHDNGDNGINIEYQNFDCTTALFSRCTIYNNTGDGINIIDSNMAVIVLNCVIDDNTQNGINVNSVARNGAILHIQNSIITNNGDFGIWIDINTTSYGFFLTVNTNAFYNNTSGAYGGQSSSDPTDITLTADPFTAASSGDFSLNSTSGGGPLCKSAGYNPNNPPW